MMLKQKKLQLFLKIKVLHILSLLDLKTILGIKEPYSFILQDTIHGVSTFSSKRAISLFLNLIVQT